MPKIGYVNIYRSLLDHRYWSEKPFTKGQAWVDILLQVNYKNEKTMIGNKLVQIKRGSMYTSYQKLADRWGWSKKGVTGYIKELKKDTMIATKSGHEGTVITVLKYGVYQNSGNAEETPRKREGNAEGNAEETPTLYKKNKKIKKIKNNISSTTRACARPTQEEVETFVGEKGLTIDPVKFFCYYEEHGWGFDWQRRAEQWDRNEYRRKKNPDQSGIAAYDMKAFEQMLADDDGEDDEES